MSGSADLPPFGDRPIAEDDLAALAAAVEDAAFQQGDFSHARHMLLALHYVRAHGPEAARPLPAARVRRFGALATTSWRPGRRSGSPAPRGTRRTSR